MKIRCPFITGFDKFIECPYIDNDKCCDDIKINPGNGDAWCSRMISQNLLIRKIYIANDY